MTAARSQPVKLRRGGRARPAARVNSAHRWKWLVTAEIIILLALWQLATGVFAIIDPSFLPPPIDIAKSLVDVVQNPAFFGNLAFTVTNYLTGLVLACLLGVGLGLAIGWYRLANRLFAPLAWLAYSIPKVAIAPVVILMLGLGAASKIAMVVLLVFFVVLTNTMEGAATVDKSYVWAARVFGVSKARLLFKVVAPASLPYIFAGLERAAALGIIGEILGEYLGSTKGIGVILQRAAYDFRMDDAFAIVVIMVLLTIAVRTAMRVSLKIFAPWYQRP